MTASTGGRAAALPVAGAACGETPRATVCASVAFVPIWLFVIVLKSYLSGGVAVVSLSLNDPVR